MRLQIYYGEKKMNILLNDINLIINEKMKVFKFLL